MGFCTKCGAPLEAGTLFCGKCGAMVEQTAPAKPESAQENMRQQQTAGQQWSVPPRQMTGMQQGAAPQQGMNVRMLTVKRKAQMFGAATMFEITVDGSSLGKVSVGGSVSIPVYSDTVQLNIQNTMIGSAKVHKWLILQIHQDTTVVFGMARSFGDRVPVTVTGATILKQGW